MRILRLDLDNEELDLHPYVTVLGGLAPGDQRRIVDRLARLACGDASGGPGLVEAHDVLSEVAPEVLDGMALDPTVDVVVHAEQLPGASIDPSSVDGSLHAADEARGRLESARAALAALDAELEVARQAVAAATTGLDDARRGLDDFAISAHDASLAALAAAEQEARTRLAGAAPVDPRVGLVAEAQVARAAVEAHEAELAGERLAMLELLEALETEQRRLDELVARRAAGHSPEEAPGPVVPSPVDVEAVSRALDAVRAGPPPAERVPSPRATDLADRIAAHDRRHDELEAELRAEGLDVVALQEQLLQAQVDAREAEVAARPKVVSAEDDAEIERLHDLVVEHGEKRNSRRGGKGAERAYEDAAAELDLVLERVGYPTYAAYVMGRIAPTVDVEARRRHEEAQARIAEIEASLDEAAAVLERDSRVLVLRAERDQLWAEARDTLGTLPDDVEGALRAMRVDAEVEFGALDELRDVLFRVGVATHGSDEVAVVAAAETYLADAALARAAAEATPGDQVDPLEAEIQAGHDRVAALRSAAVEGDEALAAWEAEAERLARAAADADQALADHDAGGAQADTDDARVARDPAVVAARDQVSLTEARLARHRAAVEQVDDRHAELRAARSAEREVEARRDAAASTFDEASAEAGEVDDTSPLPDISWSLDGDDVEPLEWYLLGRVAALRQVSHAGSVPLVLDDAFRGLPDPAARALCSALARIGESVQVVYVGDAPAVAAWAAEQGLDHAAVVRPGQPAL